jgi:succinate dehydrogenase / fumarate reductase flavoprotein subunit
MMSQNDEVYESDVLVIGGGMAGLSAAIRAKDFVDRVILVDKAKVTRSGGSIHAHAYGAPASEGDFENRLKEMVQRSAYLGDQSWFELMLREAGARMRDMERWGVLFERDEQGNLKGDAIRGQSKGFVVLAHGKQVIESIAREALRRGVRFVERVAVTDLLTSDGVHPTGGHVAGAVGLHTRTGRFAMFKSKAVVIATGLLSPKLHFFGMDNITGDGYAMAFRAGAELTGLEFSPQTFCVWNRKFTRSGVGQFQHGGAKLLNRLGQEFLYRYEGASREFIGFEGHFDQGAVCRAIAVENREGRGPCYFDCRAWGREKIDRMRKVLPLTMQAFDEPGVGVDLIKDPVEATPLALIYGTSCQSGIRINTIGETVLGGLYAAGAAAYYGGGPSPQTLGAVGGYRAGENAARWTREMEFSDAILPQAESLKEALFLPLKRKDGVPPDQIYDSVNRLVTPWEASLFKNERRIRDVLARIRQIAGDDLPRVRATDVHELVKAAESRNFVLLMELYNVAALERKESRMIHYREDYPYTDDRDWLKWILLKNGGNGGIQVAIEPVPLGCSAIMPDRLTRKPAPVPYRFDV